MSKIVRLVVLLTVGALLLSACPAQPSQPGALHNKDTQEQWQTYTSVKYQFALQFPPGWQALETPSPEFPTDTDQVWLVSEALPLPQTGSRADIVLVLTQEDPSPRWESHFFDDYKSDTLWLGDIQAKRISGINQESRVMETVVLTRLGETYLQALPNGGEAAEKYFDRVISSLRSVQTETL